MTTAYSALLGLALPVQGELSGTWGDTVNNYITNYLDAAVAGTQTLTTDADVTLTKTTGVALNGTSSQYAVINCTGARTALRTITVPATSKTYTVLNSTTGGFGVKIVGVGPTAGITVAAGTYARVVWNGVDFVLVGVLDSAGLVPVVQGGTGAANAANARANLSAAASGANADITSMSGLTTALSVAQGGTGATTAAAAAFALKGVNNDINSMNVLASINGGQLAGLRNRIINGGMAVDQRNAGAAQTFTAGAALAYAVDRWYGYCTGANVTGQRVAGSGNTQYRYQFTGAASVTKIGYAQRIEQANSFDLNNRAIVVGVELANSLLTTVTWTAWYANTADTFGTLAAPTRTSIGTGTITVNSTPTRYYVPITLPAGATTGIEIEFSVGAQTSGTWTISEANLVAGAANELWREQRPYGMELALCQRYLPAVGFSGSDYFTGQAASAILAYIPIPFKASARVAPTGILTGTVTSMTTTLANGSPVALATLGFTNAGTDSGLVTITVASGLTSGNSTMLTCNSQKILFTGCEL